MARWKIPLVGMMMATGIVATACEQTVESDPAVSSNESLSTDEAAERRAPPPPKAAFDACEGLTESASCTVQLGDHAIEGTCRKGPDRQSELACVPNHPPPGGRPGRPHAPPKEAFGACQSLAESANCTVLLGDHAIEGTCRKGPDGRSEFACVPNHPPPGGPPGRPHGPPPKEAFDACQSLAESANCTVQLGDHAIEGTCRKGPDGQSKLACAPNHPPMPPPR